MVRLLLACLFLLSSIPTQAQTSVFEKTKSRDILPGEPIGIIIDDNSYQQVSARLLSPRNVRVITARGFKSNTHWYIQMAVPNTITPGFYQLEVTLTSTSGHTRITRRIIRVNPRIFPEERIALTRQLTEVRTANPTQRAQESQNLGDVLSRPNPANWFWPYPFQFPLESIRRTGEYGARRIFVYDDGTQAISVHVGRDYGGRTGTPVMAPGDGRVVFAGFRQVTGWTIVLEHLPGIFTLYYHLDSLSVQLGQIVRQGSMIGALGNTGLSTAAHLHWEVRVGLETVDPEFYLNSPLLDNSFRIFYNPNTLQ
jgi:murein DD-endopeptidase MepM/ murein hydrolase activator NlpD